MPRCAPASEPHQDAAHSHDHGDGLEWEDLMPEINRVSDSGNMIWQLIDRRDRGGERGHQLVVHRG